MKRFIQFVFISVVMFLWSCSERKIKVACVGDSITEGYGLSYQSKTGYPVILDSILGDNYFVLNSGRSATTMQKKGDFPFWISKEFSNVFAFEPDIIVIKLGTNDSKPYNWHADNFQKDYQAMIDTFKNMPSKPKIYLCLPVPVFKTKWGINDSTVVNGIIPIIQNLGKANNLPVIDLYAGLRDYGTTFFDSIHPNEQGVKIMAEIIAKEITK